MKRSPLAAGRLVCLVSLVLTSWCLAQAPTSPAPPTNNVTIEQALEYLGKTEDRLRRQVDLTRKAIDAEVTANRLADEKAQELRATWTPLWATQITRALSHAESVKDNPALAAAYRAMDTEWAAIQSERLAVLQSAFIDARTRAIELGRTADKPHQADSLIVSVERLEQALHSLSPAFGNQLNFRHLVDFLQGLRRLLDEQQKENATNLGFAMMNWNNHAKNLHTALADAVVLARFEKIYTDMGREIDDARTAVEVALQAKAAPETLIKALDRLDQAMKRVEQVRAGYSLRLFGESSFPPSNYRELVEASLALRSGDEERAGRAVQAARSSMGENPKSPLVRRLLEGWEQELGDLSKRKKQDKEKAAANRQAAWRAGIAGARHPDDLEAVARTAREEAREEAQEAALKSAAAAQQLALLALAWRKGQVHALQAATEDSFSAFPDFAAELRAVRARAVRDVLAQVWRVPEINAPPWSELAPEAALEKLSDELAAKGQWRRLLILSENRAASESLLRIPSRVSDPSVAIREFIAAQNFELAGQWVDAAEAYKMVLRSTSERAPIKEAATRLKELQKEHADAFRPPATPAPGPKK